MTRTRILAPAVLGLSSVAALAQMQGDHGGGMQNQPHGGMDTQQSQQMMGSQIMSQDMMRDMAGLMRQLNGQMQRMQQLMDHRTGAFDAAGQHRMAEMMDEMSATMHEMAADMGAGRMDPANMQRIQRMDRMLDDTSAQHVPGKH